MVKFFASALSILLLPQLVLSIPTSDQATSKYPEVNPGPGLPSLAELGLTSEQLYTTKPKPIEARGSLLERSAQYTSVCETYTTADVDNVIACFNYLVNIGNNACGVNGDNVQFCYAGNAQITGSNISGGGSASSSCYDVALAAQWVFTYCNVNGQVGGSCAAYGNGGLVVGVENTDW